MQKSGNYSFFIAVVCFCIGLLPRQVLGGQYGVSIREASVIAQGNAYVLQVDADFQLSPVAVKALQSGIPLCWQLTAKIQRPRKWLWDETMVEKQIDFCIRYQALLNMYQINNPPGANFTTLPKALRKLGMIRNIRLLKRPPQEERKAYVAAVKISFDHESLPLPLRPESYFDADWHLSGEWYRWPVQLTVPTQ